MTAMPALMGSPPIPSPSWPTLTMSPRVARYGRIWPKLFLSGLVGLTVAGGIVLKLLG